MSTVGQRILERVGVAGDAGWQARAEIYAKRAREALDNPDAETDLPTTVDGWMRRLFDVREALSRPNARIDEDHYMTIVGASQAQAFLTSAYNGSVDAMVDGSYTSAHGKALDAAISKFGPLASAMQGACTAMSQAHDQKARA